MLLKWKHMQGKNYAICYYAKAKLFCQKSIAWSPVVVFIWMNLISVTKTVISVTGQD